MTKRIKYHRATLPPKGSILEHEDGSIYIVTRHDRDNSLLLIVDTVLEMTNKTYRNLMWNGQLKVIGHVEP